MLNPKVMRLAVGLYVPTYVCVYESVINITQEQVISERPYIGMLLEHLEKDQILWVQSHSKKFKYIAIYGDMSRWRDK